MKNKMPVDSRMQIQQITTIVYVVAGETQLLLDFADPKVQGIMQIAPEGQLLRTKLLRTK